MLVRSTRGSALSHVLPLALVALVGIGGFRALGGAMDEAVAGRVGDSAPAASDHGVAPTGVPPQGHPAGRATRTAMAASFIRPLVAATDALRRAGSTTAEVEKAFATAESVLTRRASYITPKPARFAKGNTLFLTADATDLSEGFAALTDLGKRARKQTVRAAEKAGFRGHAGEFVEVPTKVEGFKRVVVLGRGATSDLFEADAWRNVGHVAGQLARRFEDGGARFQVLLPKGEVGTAAAQHLTEGLWLSDYAFDVFKSGASPRRDLKVGLATAGGTASDAAGDAQRVRDGITSARATALARDLVNMPPNEFNTREMVATAALIAERTGLEFKAYAGDDLVKERLHLLEGVGRASENPPFMVQLTHRPKDATGKVALVGKSLMFDSGGLSLKTGGSLATMKQDMGGGAAVLAAASAADELGVARETHFFLPIAENSINGKAQRVDDIRTGRSGKSVEIGNTDAEGRLVMADALALASELEPEAIVDLATLTGANASTFGGLTAGVMGTSSGLVSRLLAAGHQGGDALWPMPLDPRFRGDMVSAVADLSNIGRAGGAGSITAGLFLAEHVPAHIPFAHMDIAGPAFYASPKGRHPSGGTGFGVGTLLRFLKD